ncbi:uncharacterized protein C19orf85 homolog [Pelodytes ibericus]
MYQEEAQFASKYHPRQELGCCEHGRDLFTFITVASSYIMRTLQRPKKSRPTKRKVNHRRFLHNQICRKYALIEAATQQLATSILSQEAETEKHQPFVKEISSNQNGTRVPRENVTNLSAKLHEMPEVDTDNSSFFGVAEANLVSDCNSSRGVSMDTLAYVSDEVHVVESLFDDIINEECFVLSPCRLMQKRAHSKAIIHKSDEERKTESHLQADLNVYKSNINSWFPQIIDRTAQPALQIPTHVNPIKCRDTYNYMVSNSVNETQLQIKVPDRKVCTPEVGRSFAFRRPEITGAFVANQLTSLAAGIESQVTGRFTIFMEKCPRHDLKHHSINGDWALSEKCRNKEEKYYVGQREKGSWLMMQKTSLYGPRSLAITVAMLEPDLGSGRAWLREQMVEN